jgi:hypothetical protein
MGLIESLQSITSGIIWVFIGESTEELGTLVGPDNYKFFIPKLENSWDHMDVFNKINIILEKEDSSPIKW